MVTTTGVHLLRMFILVGLLHAFVATIQAADRPQWGERYTRNQVSFEVGLPENFDPGKRGSDGLIDISTTENVRWVARLGNISYATPIVAEGKVLQGTNNQSPRDSRITDDCGVLMCFEEKTGRFLWQLLVPKLLKYKWADWFYCGITSPPTVENGRAYLVTNACEVVCLDLDGMADGNDGPFLDEGRHMVPEGQPPVEPGPHDADIIWLYDMTEQLGVRPHNASNCSILLDGDLLYVCTSNGVEWTHSRVANPDAPSLIVLHKRSGKLVAVDDFGIGPDIFHGQWSSPCLIEVDGRRLVVWGAGNGFVYATQALPPDTLPHDPPLKMKPYWYFNGHPLAQTQDHVPIDHQEKSTSYEVVANPVAYKGRIYVAITQDPFHGMKEGWLVCLDASLSGDITRRGLVWSYDKLKACITTCAIKDDLLYIAGFDGRVHCLDAITGKPYWVFEAGGPIWASPLLVDNKLFVCTARTYVWVLKPGKKLQVINKIRMPDKIMTTPAAANGTLYIAAQRFLYAVSSDAVSQ